MTMIELRRAEAKRRHQTLCTYIFSVTKLLGMNEEVDCEGTVLQQGVLSRIRRETETEIILSRGWDDVSR